MPQAFTPQQFPMKILVPEGQFSVEFDNNAAGAEIHRILYETFSEPRAACTPTSSILSDIAFSGTARAI